MGRKQNTGNGLRTCRQCGATPIRALVCDTCAGRTHTRNSTDRKTHRDKYADR